MAAPDAQCASRLEDTQCQLRAGHESAHAARDGTALVTWSNPAAGERAMEVVLDWHVG